jgi:hypothetical protein
MAGQVIYKTVTDGLILYLDAANPKSIISGSSTWTDISKNRNSSTLTNGPTYNSANNGSILFDGVDDYVVCDQNTEMSNIFTISSIIKLTSRNTNGTIVGSSANGADNVFRIIGDVLTCLFTESADVNNTNLIGATVLTYGIFYHVTVTVNINTVTLYLNGVQDATTTVGFNIGSWTQRMGIGRRSTTRDEWYFNGNIATVQIYNRALSTPEIQQNYNATKNRYI